MEIASTVAQGDLTSKVDEGGADEAAMLLRTLSRMNGSLSEVVSQVRATSEGIATGSAQIATGSADISQRTEEQASNLQQTASSMDEVGTTVKSNAEMAAIASQLAESAAESAARGGDVVVDRYRNSSVYRWMGLVCGVVGEGFLRPRLAGKAT